MKRPPPPLNFVRSFECAARHLSFTRAAEELGYTQAAISTHVRALEKYLARPLFTRNARSLTLTEIGEAYLPTLRRALDQIDGATEAVVAGSRDTSVVLAAPVSLAENWLPEALAAFHATHPAHEVLVHGVVWDSAVDDIADVAISILRDDEVPDGATKLWDETLMLLVAPPLAARLRIPDDLCGVGQILVSGRHEHWTIMAEALGVDALAAPSLLKTNASNISLELAANGMGATVTLASLGRIYVRRGLLVEPFDTRPRSPYSYHITQMPRGRARASQALVRHLIWFAGSDRTHDGTPVTAVPSD